MLKRFRNILLGLILVLSFVACGGKGYVLPSLEGLNSTEAKEILDNLGVSYQFVYETNLDMEEDLFVRYLDDLTQGDSVATDQIVTIVISTHDNVLPNLAGLTQLEIYTVLKALGITYVTELVTDNTVEDQTFSSYGDNLNIGDLVANDYIVTVNIGLNSEVLPDLTGYIKKQIEIELENLGVAYTIEYIVDDQYPEDTFAGYKNASIGDYYEDEIIVQLYKNTFTNSDTSLIISKYVDGGDSTNDQAIELYNATDSAINLNDYYIAIYLNGSFEEAYHINLEDLDLLPGETYIVGNWYANGNLLVKADLSTKDLVFDGNDVVQLCYKNGTFIDTIGVLGDPTFVLDNEVFVRSANVVTGTRNFNFYEWNGFVPTYYDLLGTHPVEMPTELTIEIVSRDFYDPLGGMDLVELVYTTDGDTAEFTPGFLSGERVRFIGIDTPETYTNPPEPWGLEAKAYTKAILEHADQIYIQSDPDVGYKENYGRHLGLVWCNMGEAGFTINILNSNDEIVRTEHLTGWILLNYHLILNGYSLNKLGDESQLVFDNKYLLRWFQEAERYAEANGLGVHE